MNSTSCDQCEAILREYRDAVAEMPPDVQDQYRADRESFIGMIGGTEEDVERAEQVADSFRSPVAQPGPYLLPEVRYPKIQNVFRRMMEHRFRSGHRIHRILFMK